MKDLINSYMHGSQNLNTFIIINLACQEYVFTKNQDVYEFLTALSLKCNHFRNAIEHKLTIQFSCLSCAHQSTKVQRNSIYSVELRKLAENEKPNILQNLIAHACRWKLSNSTWQHCGSENNQHKAIISSVNKAFIIQLKIMIYKKRITAYDIKKVSKTR